MKQRDNKIYGSLLGGAVGDALGYTVEFMSYTAIVARYGESGIRRYELRGGVAEFSDDTQMTLFTAAGLLYGFTRGTLRGIMASPVDYIRDAYLEWLQTQNGIIDYTRPHYCWLRNVPQLHSRRAPGTTCLTALEDIAAHREVTNHSKGCGGVMRVAPVALLYSGIDGDRGNEVIKVAGDAAYVTHHHPMGYLPAALLAYIIYRLIPEDNVTPQLIIDIVADGINRLHEVYPGDTVHINALQRLMDDTARVAASALPDEATIRQLGEGWVGEEALAIAVCCALRYPHDFERAVVAAVNHNGDSDSTGSIAGNIVGAIVGYDAIPQHYKNDLELRDVLEQVAADLAGGVPVSETGDNYATPQQRSWMQRYVNIYNDCLPIANAYFVDHGRLIIAGEYPGDKDNDKCRAKLSCWHDFVHFYDLTEAGELTPYAQYLPEWCHHHRFPIRDVDVPTDVEAVRHLIEEILANTEEASRHGGKTYIHCWGGVGRTGTIVACLFAHLMYRAAVNAADVAASVDLDAMYDRAMIQLRRAFAVCPKSRTRTIPETEAQRHFIRHYLHHLESSGVEV